MLYYSYWLQLFCHLEVYEFSRFSRSWYCSIYYIVSHEIEKFHCHRLWFRYFNICTLSFSLLKLENGPKKHARNVAWVKYGFVQLVSITHQAYVSLCFSIQILHLIKSKKNWVLTNYSPKFKSPRQWSTLNKWSVQVNARSIINDSILLS